MEAALHLLVERASPPRPPRRGREAREEPRDRGGEREWRTGLLRERDRPTGPTHRPLGRSEGEEDEAAEPQAQLHAPVPVHVRRDEAARKALDLAPVEGAQLPGALLRGLDTDSSAAIRCSESIAPSLRRSENVDQPEGVARTMRV